MVERGRRAEPQRAGLVQRGSPVMQNGVHGRCLRMRKQVHAFVLAAGITVIASTTQAQVPEMPLGSRVLPSASTGDGIGSPLTDEILNPAVILPVGGASV